VVKILSIFEQHY